MYTHSVSLPENAYVSWNGTISKLKACLPFPAFFRGSGYVSFSWSNLFKRNFSKWSLTCLKDTICFWPILIHIVTVQIGNWQVFTVKLLTWSIGSILRGFSMVFPSSKMLCLGWKLPDWDCWEILQGKTYHPNESNHLLDITKKPILDVEQTTNPIFHICCPPHPPQQLKKLADFPSKKTGDFFLSGSNDLEILISGFPNFQQWKPMAGGSY